MRMIVSNAYIFICKYTCNHRIPGIISTSKLSVEGGGGGGKAFVTLVPLCVMLGKVREDNAGLLHHSLGRERNADLVNRFKLV